MPKRCICERSSAAGPSTHKGVVHNVWLRQRGASQGGRCVHDELGRTVRKSRKLPKSRPVPGTRRVVIIDD